MTQHASGLAVSWWRIDRLRLVPGNPRMHPDAQIAKLAASMDAFGWTSPILASSGGEVIAGEARLEAARRRGDDTMPVIVLDALGSDQRRAYRIADNRIALDATWDEAVLATDIAELEAASLDVSLTGFDDAEIQRLLAQIAATAEPSLDRTPPPPAEPITRPGDIWEIGDHRLICGDSTDPATLDRLLATEESAMVLADLVLTDPPYGMAYDGGRALAERADLVVTDPPYGMAFGAGKAAGSTALGAKVKAHGMILGDDAQGADLVKLVTGALGNARAHCREGAAYYVCLTWRTYREFVEALEAQGLAIAACIVWDKASIGLGHQHYRPQHEFIFYCRGDTWHGGKGEADIWTLPRERLDAYVHPTQKPVALLARAIANSSRQGDIVLDLFGGSGSTLMACESLRRRARLVELDPKYCDVIVTRWRDHTGGRAERLAA